MVSWNGALVASWPPQWLKLILIRYATDRTKERSVAERGEGWGHGGLLIDEVMPVLVNVSCWKVTATKTDVQRGSGMRAEDMKTDGKEINDCGRWIRTAKEAAAAA